MPFEMMVGLLVVDQEKYARYRAEMTPLLEAAGGRFRYDFEVARTLKGEAAHEINRVFVIQFPDRASKERFFADSRYVEIRARLFDTSVEGRATIAEYTTLRKAGFTRRR
jgi:uncharacterized protein (DUF1330 family)